MNIVAMIPARMGSSRFPGKPMAKIHGIPMIGHVYERTKMASHLTQTWVATCDGVIAEYIESIGGQAVMTGDHHERCSDRCAEGMLKVEELTSRKIDILVMVQGDEPLVRPEMINESLNPLFEDPSIQITNLSGKIESREEFEDPNCVKVVVDSRGFALYFSREPIPSKKKFDGTIQALKQVAIIPFRRDYLLEYNHMEPTELEIIESVDMLRILERGGSVKMVPTQYNTQAVDTPADLARVEACISSDDLFSRYRSKY
ncbi:3-deoxy-manno-octulosonate cytidylyltransferase [bacterium]|nr:3-deoxy-manno-octulosonate cytidylyltransferase [bacterium]